MPYIKILIHAVWATKSRKALLNKENKNVLCVHIRHYAKSKNIRLLNINGYKNHLHGLISLEAEQDIAKVMGLIKGESSFWANRNLKFPEKFGWQDEYFAVSIGESQFNAVNDYINRQEEHHRVKSFQEEYEEFMNKYKFESGNG